MAIEVEFLTEKSRLVSVVTGEISMGELEEYFDEMSQALPAWLEGNPSMKGFDSLIDLTEGRLAFNQGDIRRLIGLNQLIPSHAQERREAVVASDSLSYGLSRMYQMLQPDKEIHVFRDRDSAEQWLDELLHREPDQGFLA